MLLKLPGEGKGRVKFQILQSAFADVCARARLHLRLRSRTACDCGPGRGGPGRGAGSTLGLRRQPPVAVLCGLAIASSKAVGAGNSSALRAGSKFGLWAG